MGEVAGTSRKSRADTMTVSKQWSFPLITQSIGAGSAAPERGITMDDRVFLRFSRVPRRVTMAMAGCALLAIVAIGHPADARALSEPTHTTPPRASAILLSDRDMGEGWRLSPLFTTETPSTASRLFVWAGPGGQSPEGVEMVWSQVVICDCDDTAREFANMERFASDRHVEAPAVGDGSRVWVSDDDVLYLEVAVDNNWIEIGMMGDPDLVTVAQARALLDVMLNRL